jgi:hypothetical protein
MKVNCLSCGHKVDLDDAYDDYDGAVKCFACRATLEIRTEQGRLRTVRQAILSSRPSTVELPVLVDTSLKPAA